MHCRRTKWKKQELTETAPTSTTNNNQSINNNLNDDFNKSPPICQKPVSVTNTINFTSTQLTKSLPNSHLTTSLVIKPAEMLLKPAAVAAMATAIENQFLAANDNRLLLAGNENRFLAAQAAAAHQVLVKTEQCDSENEDI